MSISYKTYTNARDAKKSNKKGGRFEPVGLLRLVMGETQREKALYLDKKSKKGRKQP